MAISVMRKESAKKKNLVVVPRSVYEEFLAWQRHVKGVKTFRATPAEKKILATARKNFKHGKYITLEQLQNELARRR